MRSSHELMRKMCQQISISTKQDKEAGLVFASLELATREGMSEFILQTLQSDYGLRWTVDRNRGTILSYAVRHRQAKIFGDILNCSEKDVMINYIDNKKNNILHIAGMLAPTARLNVIPGAALQIKNELWWFKKVKGIVPQPMIKALNEKDLTPQELFSEEHKDLREKGEKWMKDTATSCTIVGALIVTIMFTAAFTVPGGYNQATGFPMFSNDKWFKVFLMCDSISLLSASTSVLMFLGILTSRYEEKDFLVSLPIKMITGLSALFLSITTMMVAFCAALVLMLRGELLILIPIICLASVSVILFLRLLIGPFIDMCRSTCKATDVLM